VFLSLLLQTRIDLEYEAAPTLVNIDPFDLFVSDPTCRTLFLVKNNKPRSFITFNKPPSQKQLSSHPENRPTIVLLVKRED
jgi:hypothetical protein